jgi:hypothetical protein
MTPLLQMLPASTASVRIDPAVQDMAVGSPAAQILCDSLDVDLARFLHCQAWQCGGMQKFLFSQLSAKRKYGLRDIQLKISVKRADATPVIWDGC